MTLVAVTRIMNEDDIVEAFVRHHATMVDHHLFLDNGSSDGTLTILRALKDEGLNITVLQNKSVFFTEVNYNTALFRYARTLFSADWVIFLDTDEFIDTREAPDGLRERLRSLPEEVGVLAIPNRTYFDAPGDDQAEAVVPLRMRKRERTPPPGQSVKVFVRGQLANADVGIEAGQHEAVKDGKALPAYVGHGLVLCHYFRRSAWQVISKSVMGYLKVAAAPKAERDKNRSSHYTDVFKIMRDNPKILFEPHFQTPTLEGVDLIDDPLAYLGGPLRYAQPSDPGLKAIRVLLAYAELLADAHAEFMDTNQGVRLQAEQATYVCQQLF
jgi:hypothetical protein